MKFIWECGTVRGEAEFFGGENSESDVLGARKRV